MAKMIKWFLNWIKVFWHCFGRLVTIHEAHLMCSLIISKPHQRYYWCTCGYMEPKDIELPDYPEEGK